MMLPGFTAPGAAWLFALLVPLAVFYFLKLKRPRLTVPSLVLWQQVLSDQRVNSPFQRFKRNLLLLLQILLLTLLALAAMQPFLRRETVRAARLPVLIDNSASMAALDKPGGISRLDAAKKRVRELIGALPGDQEICLVSFAKTARKRSSFTSDKRALREALDGIVVEDVPGEIEDALRLSQALARTAPFDSVLLLSDGNFSGRANLDLPFKVNYERLGPAGENIGITACSARRDPGGNWEVFLQIEGSEHAEGGGAAEIRLDGAMMASERFALAKGGSQRISFSVAGERPSTLQARLVPDGFDSLASDNFVSIQLPAVRTLDVFAPESLPAWRRALQSAPGIRLHPPGTNARYDVVISDQAGDLALPTRLFCGIGFVPPELEKFVSIGQAAARPVDWRRDSPLLQHVEFADVIAMDDPRLQAGATADAMASAGWEVLVHGPRGPMIVEKQNGETRSVFVLFHTDRSTLPYRVGFPVFVANLIQAARNQAGIAQAEAHPTGTLPRLQLQPGGTYEIVSPEGGRRVEKADTSGELSGVPALRAGEYLILENAALRTTVGASLLSPAETGLRRADQIQFNEHLSASASAAPLKTDRSLWHPLACLAFALLLFEWWLFQKRPAGFSA